MSQQASPPYSFPYMTVPHLLNADPADDLLSKSISFGKFPFQ